jgi:ribosomal-protein-alanine N-acetyltransferase
VPIRLISIDRQLSETLRADTSEFESRYHCSLGEVDAYVREVVEQGLSMHANQPPERPWGIYLGVDGTTGQIVGTCGFKGDPSEDGTVEFAYFTFPLYEQQGYGTDLVQSLLAMARSASNIVLAVTFTPPREYSATRILKKIGMRFAGPVDVPAGGTVWRWEIQLK